jgi:hypothetical protein
MPLIDSFKHEEGKMMVTKVDSKKFIGKNIRHVAS